MIFEAQSIEIELKNGKIYPVEYVANYNENLDIALLKVLVPGLSVLTLGNSDDLAQGDKVFSIGHPGAKKYLVSHGEFVDIQIIDEQNYFNFKMFSDQGSSGGPIFDENGKVVAVSTLGRSDIKGYSFGLPINTAKKYFDNNKVLPVEDFSTSISQPFKLTYQGQGALLEGKYTEAIDFFKKALASDPNYIKAKIGLGNAYAAMNKEQEAAEAWLAVIKPKSQNMLKPMST